MVVVVITWDILANQAPSEKNRVGNLIKKRELPQFAAQAAASRPSVTSENHQACPQLSFAVHNAFMIGSPVAVFLMIRNQHQPMCDDFCLPGCQRVFNIFHPYDPAAYRIEPLLNRKFASVEAKIITHWKGGFRVQYQTKLMFKRIVDETRNVQRLMFETVERGITTVAAYLLGTQNEDNDDDDVGVSFSESEDEQTVHVLRCGKLNQGRRIDYMLQEKEIENANEYVFAIGAHSAYWDEKDLSLFIAREVIRSRLDAELATSFEEPSNMKVLQK